MDWPIPAACGAATVILFLRCLSLQCRRPPRRFWLGLALIVPVFLGSWLPYTAAWHSVFAAWGLWLSIDSLAEACERPSLLGDQPDAAVWAIVISVFGWAGIEQLNEYFPVWTSLGFSFNPLAREIAVGLLGGAVVPTVVSVAAIAAPATIKPAPEANVTLLRVVGCLMVTLIFLIGSTTAATAALSLLVTGLVMLLAPRHLWPGSSRQVSLLIGAVTWTAFDLLWSQLGPAQRFFVDFGSPAYLPAALCVCAFLLVPISQATAELLDKPQFDPFHRD